MAGDEEGESLELCRWGLRWLGSDRGDESPCIQEETASSNDPHS